MSERTTYRWHWACLSLFMDDGDSSSRVFTLKPAWVWQHWQNFVMVGLGCWPPDPFWVCEKWLRRNNLWHLEGVAFYKAISRYAASCESGQYVKLQPKFLK